MYTHFYGLTEKPFDVTSNPKYLFLPTSHREALAALVYGIQERRGIMVIVGEVGTGKTTLLRAAMEQLEETTRFAHIFYTNTDFPEQLKMVAEELKISSPAMRVSEAKLFSRLKEFAEFQAKKNQNVAILIDEAQNLDFQTLENYRLLSNIESKSGKLVQIVFSGQPELETKLKDHRLRQLEQRISLRRYLAPLTREETRGYIAHRLEIAGGEGIFSDECLELIWEYSGGIPRKINMLCDNALLIGYGLEQKKITAEIIREARDDLTRSPFTDEPIITNEAPRPGTAISLAQPNGIVREVISLKN
ncbi:ExeA family protein [Desulfococcus sp.]|uniref:ExeA family protein n=1 Tax=Desulfococcus sp. TaxID=2025834 RepID=UPI003592FFB9